jgi:Vacuolar sorting protein 9 (VPS9) domain
MGMLHNKIWVQSLPGFLSVEDSNLEVLSIAYCRDTFALGKYGINGQLASMPRKYLTGAIACLQQLDADYECYRIVSHHYDEEDEDEGSADPAGAVINIKPALTPLEKLKCVRDTLDRISQAAEKYLLDMSLVNEAHEGKLMKCIKASVNCQLIFLLSIACVTTDQLIPLAMFALIHARIPRLASMIFYMEHFSFEVGKNSDLK